jgi:hypothetical protein
MNIVYINHEDFGCRGVGESSQSSDLFNLVLIFFYLIVYFFLSVYILQIYLQCCFCNNNTMEKNVAYLSYRK